MLKFLSWVFHFKLATVPVRFFFLSYERSPREASYILCTYFGQCARNYYPFPCSSPSGIYAFYYGWRELG